MKRVLDLCVKAGSEDQLDQYATEFETIRAEVRTLARQFPIPGIPQPAK